MKFLFAFIVVLATTVGFAGEIESGLKVGAFAEPFSVKDCTGPAAGKTLCYFCRYASRPMVAIFVDELSDDVIQAIRQTDAAVRKYRGERMAAFVIYTGKDTLDVEKRLKELAKTQDISHTPLTILRETPAQLQAKYQINAKAKITILMLRSGRVRDRLGFDSVDIDAATLKSFPTRLDGLLK